MAIFKKRNLKYNVFNPDQLKGIYQAPIVSDTRAPVAGDMAEIGTIWIDKDSDTAYILTSITANAANWENFTDEVTTAGTDGQLWIGATGAAAAWANLTSTGLSVTITNTANGINLEAAGVAALTTLDGDSGTATPVAGVIIVAGGTNITTAGAAGTLTVNLDASPSVAGSLTAATSITAGVDFDMNSGDCTIIGDTDGAETILLQAAGGTSETIHLEATLGTGINSIDLTSASGGITLDAGLAAANSIVIDASNAAGGIDVDAGTGGINITATNGAIALVSGTGAITVGTDAAAHAVTVGSTNTTSATTIQSGTGDLALTSTDDITIDGAGVLEINSSAGVIGIGSDADAQNINIGTGASARVITIGNVTAATGVVVDCGTGDLSLGASATAHNTTLGSTNSTCDVLIQSGTGNTAMTSTGDTTVDCAGVLELNSSAGVIGIGNDAVAQDINLGTGGAARTITVGNATGATSVVLNAGTGAVNIGTNAIAHATSVGSVTGAAATTLQAGTGALTVDGLGIIDIDAAGALSLNSDGGVINIGDDADAQNMNIGTGGAARVIQIGNATGATEVEITGGTAGITLTPTGGAITMLPAVGSVAGVTVVINAFCGEATFTGQTTASAAEQVFTVTNSVSTTASVVFATVSNAGANDAQMALTRVEQKAGSIEFTTQNLGAAALNGDVQIAFWIIKA